MGAGSGPGLTPRSLGEEIGEENTVLTVQQMPSHDHLLRASNNPATATQPAGNVLAAGSTAQYLNASTSVVLGTDAISASGSNAPHNTVQPSTVIQFIIFTGKQ